METDDSLNKEMIEKIIKEVLKKIS